MSRTIASGLAVLALTGMSVVTVAAPASAAKPPCRVNPGGHYPPGLCKGSSVTQSTQTPAAGGSITFSFTDVAPGSKLTLTLENGETLGAFTANVNGAVNATVKLACSLSGPHTLTATGKSAEGNPITFTTGFTATACSAAGAGSSGSLPFTGANTAAEGAAGFGLLAAGTLAVVFGRRRRDTSVK